MNLSIKEPYDTAKDMLIRHYDHFSICGNMRNINKTTAGERRIRRMDIVVCGAGKLGETLCRDLCSENHHVVVIDKNKKRIEQMVNTVDLSGVVGNGALLDIQLEAGVATCDIFMAVTPDDEVNIIAAITAKKIGARYVVARVRSPEYSLQMNFLRESLGITLMINPDLVAARAIENMMHFPHALGVDSFSDGRLYIVDVELPENSTYDGMSLKEIGRQHGNVLIGIIERNADVMIPRGDVVLHAGDRLYLTGLPSEIRAFCQQDMPHVKRPQSALIVGGGRVTRYLLPRLEKMQMRVKVIEQDEDQADLLSGDFPRVEVIWADGTDQEILREERLHNYDVVIALTGVDEENILISIYAYHEGVEKTITKVNRTNLLKILSNVGLQAIITPHRLIADHIIRFVRSTENTEGADIDAFYRLSSGRVEVFQFHITNTSAACDKPLRLIKMKSGVLILCIMRDDEILFPAGNDEIRVGDDVLVVTTRPDFRDITDILE